MPHNNEPPAGIDLREVRRFAQGVPTGVSLGGGGVSVGVTSKVGVGVDVWMTMGVSLGVAVGVSVGTVGDGTSVVAVTDGVSLGVGVGVGVAVGMNGVRDGVGIGWRGRKSRSPARISCVVRQFANMIASTVVPVARASEDKVSPGRTVYSTQLNGAPHAAVGSAVGGIEAVAVGVLNGTNSTWPAATAGCVRQLRT